jgi:hypothetical protein
VGGIKREVQETRTNRAEALLIELSSSVACVAALMDEFAISERAAWRDLARARERWKRESAELGPEEREGARERMRRTLRYVQTRGFAVGELRSVLGATKQLRDLDGLDVPKELRLSGALGFVDASNIFHGRSTDDLIAFLRTGRLPSEGPAPVDE